LLLGNPLEIPSNSKTFHLSAGYFHTFSSRVAASVVGIDNDREGQRSGYQLPPVAGQNSIKIGSFLRDQKFFTSSKLQRLLHLLPFTLLVMLEFLDFCNSSQTSEKLDAVIANLINLFFLKDMIN
jgi:hypothetical protein